MESNAKALDGKYLFIDLPNQQLNDREITVILYNLTGCFYSFAAATDMKWGENGEEKTSNLEFYQLMPDSEDGGFFDWYCDVRTYHQFFDRKEDAVLHFINYWFQWKYANLGKKISK